MTEEYGEIPNILRTHPKVTLFAYVNAHPQNQVMGVTIDERTGAIIQHCILPTRQRVMLGLGIGDDNANAHHAYRQKYPHGYDLVWIDDPDTDPRTQSLKKKLIGKQKIAQAVQGAINELRETEPAPKPSPPPDLTGQLTAELMRAGARTTKPQVADTTRDAADRNTKPDPAEDSRTGTPPKPDTGTHPQPDTPKSDFGGFF